MTFSLLSTPPRAPGGPQNVSISRSMVTILATWESMPPRPPRFFLPQGSGRKNPGAGQFGIPVGCARAGKMLYFLFVFVV